ncbi:MAG: single-stranded-DNA-specific exonuclease RecJ [Polyangiaceae bacterium]|nr:single-stranded-DNA-specific exonuclease RecJ [Polyangiaceae bacterium]MCL4749735.1 single-stranded-DNA-specific exonuclease RecJ [Myxococcales bacterium]
MPSPEVAELVPSPRPSLPAEAPPEAHALARAAGLTVTIADLMQRRGLTDPTELARFMDPKLSHLTPPDGMADRDAAAERIAFAIQQGETIAVFGDYDCDGITSAAIMTGILRALGGTVVPLLASRFDGGYGVSPAAVERIAASSAKLLVTCDCGSSDHVTLTDVRARGLDVIVIDHHLVPDEPLPTVAFLNPHRPECAFPYKGLASCGLALSVGAAVRARLGQSLDLRVWLDLVAIGTIADVAPLDGDNRALVRAGLRTLAEGRRPGVRALLELARFDAAHAPSGEDVAFRIAPRINAPGRLGKPDLALELLLATSHEEARAIGAEIERLSTERRSIQEKMIVEAVREIEEAGYHERPAIVVGRAGWNHGIVGIVAGRLASRYGKPVIAVGFEPSGHGRGSVRGPKGSRLHDALSQVQDVLERFGGHQAAAGVELRLDRLEDLREGFEKACEAAPALAPEDEHADTVWLHAADSPARVLGDVARLEPCGQGNPAPRVAVQAELVAAREVKGGHLKLELELPSSGRMSGFGVSMGARAGQLSGRVVVLGRLRRDAWRGGDAVEMRVEDVIGD